MPARLPLIWFKTASVTSRRIGRSQPSGADRECFQGTIGAGLGPAAAAALGAGVGNGLVERSLRLDYWKRARPRGRLARSPRRPPLSPLSKLPRPRRALSDG